MTRTLALAAFLCCAWTIPGIAQSSSDSAARVARILQESDAGVQGEVALARSLRTPATEEALRRKAAQQAEFSVHAYVVGAIAENPGNVAPIVAGAVSAAPQYRDSIVRTVTQAFPFLGPTIAAAAGRTAVVTAAPPPAAPAPLPPRPATPPAAVAQAPSPAPVTEVPSASPATPTDDDPLEGFNRAVFAFNDVFDRFLLRPIAYGYGYVTPDFVKRGVRNVFTNLGSPVVLANDVFQLDGSGAVTTTGRFLINSTVGVLGFFDVAKEVGMPGHPADFGQTLHRYGAGAGPYLVLPLLGPSSVRDGFGRVVDTFLDPLTYVLDFYPRLAVTAGDGVTRRETLITPLDDLRANSVDYYAALRSAYFQDRAVALQKGRAVSGPTASDKAFEEFE